MGRPESLNFHYLAPSLLAWRKLELGAYRRPSSGTGPILDLGCGHGYFSQGLGVRPYGLDLDLRQVRSGVQKNLIRGGVCGDLRRLPFRDGAAKEMVANCVFEHIEQLPRVLREVSRVMVVGGRLQTTVPVLHLNHNLLLRAPWYLRMRNRQLVHVNLMAQDEWIETWKRHGFSVVRSEAVLRGGQARRWDLIDSTLFIGWGRFTWFNLYQKMVQTFGWLRRIHVALSGRLASWIMRGHGGSAVCYYFELEKL